MESLFDALRKFNASITERGISSEIKQELQRLSLSSEARDKLGSTPRTLDFLAEVLKVVDEEDFDLVATAFEQFLKSK